MAECGAREANRQHSGSFALPFFLWAALMRDPQDPCGDPCFASSATQVSQGEVMTAIVYPCGFPDKADSMQKNNNQGGEKDFRGGQAAVGI